MLAVNRSMTRKIRLSVIIFILVFGIGLAGHATSFAYEKIKLKVSTNESTSCRGNNPKCPPYVIYYTKTQRDTLKLKIEDGLVMDSRGKPLNTRGADYSNYIDGNGLMPAAIFVMDLDGNIYASNAHKTYLFQHSTILAGDSVAAAGEMIVRDGVIKAVNPCSGHYKPDAVTSAAQLLYSLKAKSYPNWANITLYSDKICDTEKALKDKTSIKELENRQNTLKNRINKAVYNKMNKID